MKGFSIAGP